MKLNLNKIKELYGETVKNEINEERELVENNLEFLYQLGFRNLDDIFYNYSIAFLQNKQKFQNKVLMLCKKIGDDYLNVLTNNIDLWEFVI